MVVQLEANNIYLIKYCYPQQFGLCVGLPSKAGHRAFHGKRISIFVHVLTGTAFTVTILYFCGSNLLMGNKERTRIR